ncbi:M48 family metallopeptidase [Hymenobacter lutimineralis]|uniref:M48 family metallopeptidase n=1 Tax=Hymenobacter lutimineralis TaxID=2606448 RepID=A0A5D6VDK1_9BACT|nr:M48 family metallopeptidase [Hymenobacter lutimineralis]TYZ13357.1 M48 family metallopeptidase [Hymenobacter lutimineralis]
MPHNSIVVMLRVACLLLLTGCVTVPFTGRTQWNLVNRVALNQSVEEAYQAIKDSLAQPTDTSQAGRVQRVGRRLAVATEGYLRQKGQSNSLQGVNWVFLVVEDSSINASAFPGGKIFVTTGMLRVCPTDTLLASVLGHEMGHVLAGHTAESYSKLMVNMVGMVAVAAVDVAQSSTRAPGDTTRLLDSYNGLQQLGSFAHSRKQEGEADRIGMILMALAAYPPAAQAELWERIGRLEPGYSFALENSHPTHGRRVRQARQRLPEALRYWQGPPLSQAQRP